MDAQGYTRINKDYSYDHNSCGLYDHRFDIIYNEYEDTFIGGMMYRVFDNFATNSEVALIMDPKRGIMLDKIFVIQPAAVEL